MDLEQEVKKLLAASPSISLRGLSLPVLQLAFSGHPFSVTLDGIIPVQLETDVPPLESLIDFGNALLISSPEMTLSALLSELEAHSDVVENSVEDDADDADEDIDDEDLDDGDGDDDDEAESDAFLDVDFPLMTRAPHTLTSLNTEVLSWMGKNPLYTVDILKVDPQDRVVEIACSLPGQEETFVFSIAFDQDWYPIHIETSHSALQFIRAELNEFPANCELQALLDHVAQVLSREMSPGRQRQRLLDRHSEFYIQPTVQDWEEVVLPNIRQGLISQGKAPYEADEWVRRIHNHLKANNLNQALRMICLNLFPGQPSTVPVEIVPYLPLTWLQGFPGTYQDTQDFSYSGTPETTKWLRDQYRELGNQKKLGFSATPTPNDPYQWLFRLYFQRDSRRGQELKAWIEKTIELDEKRVLRKRPLAEVQLEVRFPFNYPAAPPSFRVIEPRFKGELPLIEETLSQSNDTSGQAHLELSGLLEKAPLWVPGELKPLRLLGEQLKAFIEASPLPIDLDSGIVGHALPTVGGFWRTYSAQRAPAASENGGKIILPVSAIQEIETKLENPQSRYSPDGFLQANSETQMKLLTFELSARSGRRSFCGVLEFSAEPGTCAIPSWMLENIGVLPGEEVEVRRVELPRGKFIRFQPHHSDFIKLGQSKAVLEWVLRNFVALAPGDTLAFTHDSQLYKLEVLEVKPGRAITIIDTDVEVDFAPALSGSLTLPAPSPMPSPAPASSVRDSGSQLGVATTSEDTTPCQNCRRHIPKAVFSNHSLSCARLNLFCEQCGQAVPRPKFAEHVAEVHSDKPCELCGEKMLPDQIAAHQNSACPKKNVPCMYCDLSFLRQNLAEHENSCGALSTECDACGTKLVRRELLPHLSVCDGTKAASSWAFEPTDPAFSTRRPSARPAPVPPTFQCEVCTAPFEEFDDLQVHMLTTHADMLG